MPLTKGSLVYSKQSGMGRVEGLAPIHQERFLFALRHKLARSDYSNFLPSNDQDIEYWGDLSNSVMFFQRSSGDPFYNADIGGVEFVRSNNHVISSSKNRATWEHFQYGEWTFGMRWYQTKSHNYGGSYNALFGTSGGVSSNGDVGFLIGLYDNNGNVVFDGNVNRGDGTDVWDVDYQETNIESDLNVGGWNQVVISQWTDKVEIYFNGDLIFDKTDINLMNSGSLPDFSAKIGDNNFSNYNDMVVSSIATDREPGHISKMSNWLKGGDY